ncbi:MAG: malto-oligosyltrehalose trehalohydrolase [Candidatus Rokubacteria bacterium]|nr:malto-oligosyltrehalose trehalohydrolase [Candidatus Rokubacteria bacterium]
MGTSRTLQPFQPDRLLGATCLPDGRVRFLVWAPRCRSVEVELLDASPHRIPMARRAGGYHEAVAPGGPGLRYFYVLDGERRRPDPAARALPEGVHGPAEVVDPAGFHWTDAGWRGRPLEECVLYELHVGTFTPEGTFAAVIPRLPRLAELGVTAIELMPVASFPGARNWGYDGVGLFAPQRTYGGPAGLQLLVDAAHAHGLAVVLDVVYNHLGPEGNYLAEFGPYFTDCYHTPWGPAVNYDGGEAAGARRFFIENAVRWVGEYHIDSLRLDAIHGIFDGSPVHILRALNTAVQRVARRLGRRVPVVAESPLNDRRVIDPVRKGGYGLAGQWSDDFHHALHTLLTGERTGYYLDYGRLDQLARAYTDGFVYQGEPSAYRGGRPHGTPSREIPGERFVVFAQNHDQVGNRARGERLGALVPFEALKVAAAATLLGPTIPLLFMGEEYGEPAPFLYFTSHGDPGLGEAVRRGRREEFAAFGWAWEIPDPQAPATFEASRLCWELKEAEPHARLRAFYRTLLGLRREHPVLGPGGKRGVAVEPAGERALAVFRRRGSARAFFLLNLGPTPATVCIRAPAGAWTRLLSSREERFGGPGVAGPERLVAGRGGRLGLELPGHCAVVYLREPGSPAR